LAAGWAAHVPEQHIGDFSKWKQHDVYQQAFARLLRDLQAEQR
jgi:hydrogenase maturation factor HypF (carbamoyltransferase family)